MKATVRPAATCGVQRRERRRRGATRLVDLTGGEGRPAAAPGVDDGDAATGGAQECRQRGADLRLLELDEAVGEDDDVRRRVARRDAAEAPRGESGERPLMGHAEAVGDHARLRRRCERVDDRRDGRSQAREAAEVADRARQRRHALSRAQLREPLHLEGRHVDAGGALRLAGFAGDTGAEDLAELRGVRAVQGESTAEQALQHVGARPGAQALVTRRRRRRAHRAAQLLAQAGTEAPLDRQVEPALRDVGEPWPPGAVGTVLGPEAQVVGHGPAVEDDARRQQSAWVEGVLEVGEGRP